MMLVHQCPLCKKKYEREATPEPDQICDSCINRKRIIIQYNSGNTPIQKDEELFVHQEIEKLLGDRGITLENIYFE